jgi:hypothetical protein
MTKIPWSRSALGEVNTMKSFMLVALVFFTSSVCLGAPTHTDNLPREFSDCLKRTEHDRMSCQSGCGMILQQCYDAADDALTAKTDTLVKKRRSASCTLLLKKYADDSAQLGISVADQAGSQPGWLAADLKMNLLQQRYDTVQLIDAACK